MYVEGMCVLSIGRTLGVKLGTIYSRLKKSIQARTVPRVSLRQRRAGPARVIAFDEMRCGLMWAPWWRGKRRSRRVWTAVVVELDGLRWADFEVGGQDVRAFLRLYGRLPEAELYCTDDYRVYGWLLANRHLAGKDGAVNQNEGAEFVFAWEVEPVGEADERVQPTGGCTAGWTGSSAGAAWSNLNTSAC